MQRKAKAVSLRKIAHGLFVQFLRRGACQPLTGFEWRALRKRLISREHGLWRPRCANVLMRGHDIAETIAAIDHVIPRQRRPVTLGWKAPHEKVGDEPWRVTGQVLTDVETVIRESRNNACCDEERHSADYTARADHEAAHARAMVLEC